MKIICSFRGETRQFVLDKEYHKPVFVLVENNSNNTLVRNPKKNRASVWYLT